MTQKKIRIKIIGEDAHTAYVLLPGHTKRPGVVAKMVNLDDLLEYSGPRIHLDLDSNGVLIGIEILTFG